MSYLVDALKKAERERHEQRGADMHSLSSGELPFAGAGPSGVLRWFVAALVICNVGLLGYLLWPAADNQAGPDSALPPQSVSESGTSQAASAETALSVKPTPPVPAVASSRATDRPVRGQSDRTASAMTGLRMSDEPSAVRGRVTYSQTPLDDSSATLPPPGNLENAPSVSDLGGAVPDVAINGHLFSSVPGRSFILVNGRRYHEGERLAAGPAIESIDATGATLNYQGQRYHVNGPG